MRRIYLVAAFISLLVIGSLLLMRENGSSDKNSSSLDETVPSASQSGAVSSLSAATSESDDGLSDSVSETQEYIDLDILPVQELGKTEFEEDDIHHLMGMIFFYKSRVGGGLVPTGVNEDFVDVLTGGNSERTRLIKRTHSRIDEKGRFIDRWGTPYFFHSISSGKFSIRSAGPDLIFETEDDIFRTTERS